jgi:hypothetical protein
MEFLLYLTPTAQEVYQLVARRISVVENAPICRKQAIYGWFDSRKKTMTICTHVIRASSRDARADVSTTLLHEAVHVAQSCKNSFGKIHELGMPLARMSLSPAKKADLAALVANYGVPHRNLEHEAFWLEDQPGRVRAVVRKYCL